MRDARPHPDLLRALRLKAGLTQAAAAEAAGVTRTRFTKAELPPDEHVPLGVDKYLASGTALALGEPEEAVPLWLVASDMTHRVEGLRFLTGLDGRLGIFGSAEVAFFAAQVLALSTVVPQPVAVAAWPTYIAEEILGDGGDILAVDDFGGPIYDSAPARVQALAFVAAVGAEALEEMERVEGMA